jgi:hypothetical protein
MTFTTFLSVLFGAMAVAATLAWLTARGDGGSHH